MKKLMLQGLSKDTLLKVYNKLNNVNAKQLRRQVLIDELMKHSYNSIIDAI